VHSPEKINALTRKDKCFHQVIALYRKITKEAMAKKKEKT
jgi:hypothetical protein